MMYSNNRFALALFSLLLVGLVNADEDLEANPTSDSASRLELLDLNGQLYRLFEYRGKVVLVNFWTSWCTSCIKEFPSLKGLNHAIDARRFVLLAGNVREGKGITERFRLKEVFLKLSSDTLFLLVVPLLITKQRG